MQTYTNFQETILQLFVEIDLHLSKPLKTMLASLIVCLLENNKAHISRLGRMLRDQQCCERYELHAAYSQVFVKRWDIASDDSSAADTSYAPSLVKSS
jgi:hypothetical protein